MQGSTETVVKAEEVTLGWKRVHGRLQSEAGRLIQTQSRLSPQRLYKLTSLLCCTKQAARERERELNTSLRTLSDELAYNREILVGNDDYSNTQA